MTTDPYEGIAHLDEDRVLALAAGLETRARDPRPQEMCQSYLSDIEFPDQASVVDVGCGTGPVSRLLASFPLVQRVYGLDPSPVLLSRARQLTADEPKVTYGQAAGMALPLSDRSVDVVVLHTVLSHVPDPRQVVTEPPGSPEPEAGSPPSTPTCRRSRSPGPTTIRCSAW